MLVLFTDSNDEKTGWEDWVGRKKTLLILMFFMLVVNLCVINVIKNVFNAFL